MGGNFNSKSADFGTCYKFFPKKVHILPNFCSKNANWTIFSQKSANLENFFKKSEGLLKVINKGKLFHPPWKK